MTDDMTPDAIEMTAHIVSAYLTNNNLAASDLPSLISSVHRAIAGAGAPIAEPPVPLQPAVPIKKSITPEFLISLEDGKKYKSLRRHLSAQGMTPDEYRAKWGLPKDYPMVAASYSEARSALAKSLGLGRKSAPFVAPAPIVKAAKAPAKGRGKSIKPQDEAFS